MTGNAIFRFPYASTCQYVCGETIELDSVAGLDGHEGFVMAPFEVTPQRPVNVIRPERYWTDLPIYGLSYQLDRLDKTLIQRCWDFPAEGWGGEEAHYTRDFARFHERLLAGDFQKLVLARAEDVLSPRGAEFSPIELFQLACTKYPRLFIALVYTPKSGLWLTATPEILLVGGTEGWLTTALAGTKRLTVAQRQQDCLEDITWSDKSRQEQQLVADYISDCLRSFAAEVSMAGPYTVRAADLVHLRTDFHFTMQAPERIGPLLQALHPTPAVCGLPKQQAFNFILQNEHTPRAYYSGFQGPLGLEPPQSLKAEGYTTHLYVSLRCMRIFPRYCQLYAGGGLLPESEERAEWMETVAKMQTMHDVVCSSGKMKK